MATFLDARGRLEQKYVFKQKLTHNFLLMFTACWLCISHRLNGVAVSSFCINSNGKIALAVKATTGHDVIRFFNPILPACQLKLDVCFSSLERNSSSSLLLKT
jgi:hypothetical protein